MTACSDSTSALELKDIPKRLLVIGGGIIGLEMATVYDALGLKDHGGRAARWTDPGADRDIIRPLHKRIEKRYEAILPQDQSRQARSHARKGSRPRSRATAHRTPQVYDRVLLAVGRRPNGKTINAEAAGVLVNEARLHPRGSEQMRTNVPHIYAIGDIVGEPMLAHKASYEGKLAAEVIAGHRARFRRAHHSVGGLYRSRGRLDGVDRNHGQGARHRDREGRVSLGCQRTRARDRDATKASPSCSSTRARGACWAQAIVGANAGELIAETVLALEMGADAEDIGLTIHPHPTLSETIFFSAEIAEDSITDLYMPEGKTRANDRAACLRPGSRYPWSPAPDA